VISTAAIAAGATVSTPRQLRAVESYYETIPEAAAYNAIAGSHRRLRQRDPAAETLGRAHTQAAGHRVS